MRCCGFLGCALHVVCWQKAVVSAPSEQFATSVKWVPAAAAAGGPRQERAGRQCRNRCVLLPLQEAREQGLEYCGWDVGHVPECHYSAAQHAEAYGVELPAVRRRQRRRR